MTTVTQSEDRYDLMDRLQKRGIPAGVVQTAKDRCTRDQQLQARGYFVPLPHSEIGTWPIENFPAKFQNMPVYVGGLPGRGAPCIGEDNEYVYGELLGMSAQEIKALADEGVI
jgi:crotonobetainyl-CoA:carnitine CoA-transferase CaiB-like acyl-CoA transferase